jgi:hypothetical protein
MTTGVERVLESSGGESYSPFAHASFRNGGQWFPVAGKNASFNGAAPLDDEWRVAFVQTAKRLDAHVPPADSVISVR